ncbi:hypothetical protein TTHERM_001306871 (macronuclear) [Tetrahymena thermophila SB210]|uniref:Uncharacterized protein n=1 Tax=Tetrahymena thermophila (strain SB210) TaxID=312017 RepID=W7X5J7_TETTS|nr:hypothetical protein TTHERM_001306871 [Tetrahymena thermophila SB210]EWS71633.1 hypothetical protein TTHERM_001306871 [Tetrahymena thermophila SB210]|eukprot:XP_012655835.1 hypothetical protein TTHERM_001306871 [Tetrahymena thermophila SB210]
MQTFKPALKIVAFSDEEQGVLLFWIACILPLELIKQRLIYLSRLFYIPMKQMELSELAKTAQKGSETLKIPLPFVETKMLSTCLSCQKQKQPGIETLPVLYVKKPRFCLIRVTLIIQELASDVILLEAKRVIYTEFYTFPSQQREIVIMFWS